MNPGQLPISVKTVSANPGERIIFDFPQGAPLTSWGLRVTGNLVVGTNPATAAQSGGIVNVLRSVTIGTKGAVRFPAIEGRFFKLLHQLHSQNSIDITEPALTVGTNAFSFTLERLQQMPRMLVPWQNLGLLPVNLVRDMQLIVDVDTVANCYVAGGGGTVAFSGITIEFFVVQATGATPGDLASYIVEQVGVSSSTDLLTASGYREFRLNTGGLYRHMILVAESTSGGLRSFDDTLISSVTLEANVTRFCKELSWGALKAKNRREFQLTAALPGVAVLDWTQGNSPDELFNADPSQLGGVDLKLIPFVANTAAASKFSVIGVRCFGNFPAIG